MTRPVRSRGFNRGMRRPFRGPRGGGFLDHHRGMFPLRGGASAIANFDDGFSAAQTNTHTDEYGTNSREYGPNNEEELNQRARSRSPIERANLTPSDKGMLAKEGGLKITVGNDYYHNEAALKNRLGPPVGDSLDMFHDRHLSSTPSPRLTGASTTPSDRELLERERLQEHALREKLLLQFGSRLYDNDVKKNSTSLCSGDDNIHRAPERFDYSHKSVSEAIAKKSNEPDHSQHRDKPSLKSNQSTPSHDFEREQRRRSPYRKKDYGEGRDRVRENERGRDRGYDRDRDRRRERSRRSPERDYDDREKGRERKHERRSKSKELTSFDNDRKKETKKKEIEGKPSSKLDKHESSEPPPQKDILASFLGTLGMSTSQLHSNPAITPPDSLKPKKSILKKSCDDDQSEEGSTPNSASLALLQSAYDEEFSLRSLKASKKLVDSSPYPGLDTEDEDKFLYGDEKSEEFFNTKNTHSHQSTHKVKNTDIPSWMKVGNTGDPQGVKTKSEPTSKMLLPSSFTDSLSSRLEKYVTDLSIGQQQQLQEPVQCADNEKMKKLSGKLGGFSNTTAIWESYFKKKSQTTANASINQEVGNAPVDQPDPTIANILKSIGFDFEMSKRMQELAKQSHETSKEKEEEQAFGIDTATSFLGGGLSTDMKSDLFQKEVDVKQPLKTRQTMQPETEEFKSIDVVRRDKPNLFLKESVPVNDYEEELYSSDNSGSYDGDGGYGYEEDMSSSSDFIRGSIEDSRKRREGADYRSRLELDVERLIKEAQENVKHAQSGYGNRENEALRFQNEELEEERYIENRRQDSKESRRMEYVKEDSRGSYERRRRPDSFSPPPSKRPTYTSDLYKEKSKTDSYSRRSLTPEQNRYRFKDEAYERQITERESRYTKGGSSSDEEHHSRDSRRHSSSDDRRYSSHEQRETRAIDDSRPVSKYDRSPHRDDKKYMSRDDKKYSSRDDKRQSSHDERRYSSEDRRYSSEDRRYSSQDDRKYSRDDLKSSPHDDRRNTTKEERRHSSRERERYSRDDSRHSRYDEQSRPEDKRRSKADTKYSKDERKVIVSEPPPKSSKDLKITASSSDSQRTVTPMDMGSEKQDKKYKATDKQRDLREKLKDKSRSKVFIAPCDKEKLEKEFSERKHRLENLETELEKLRKQQNELMRRRQRQKDGHKDPILIQNGKLQEEISAQIKALRVVSEENAQVLASASTSIEDKSKDEKSRSPVLAENKKTDAQEQPKPSENKAPEEKMEKKVFYEFFDPGSHWCRSCNNISSNIYEVFLHLQSKKHMQKLDPYNRPWMTEEVRKPPKKPLDCKTQVAPIRGVEFMMASQAFYCSLCEVFSGDEACAEAHLKSSAHHSKYEKYIEENQFYERRLNLDKAAGVSMKRDDEAREKRKAEDDSSEAEKKRRVDDEKPKGIKLSLVTSAKKKTNVSKLENPLEKFADPSDEEDDEESKVHFKKALNCSRSYRSNLADIKASSSDKLHESQKPSQSSLKSSSSKSDPKLKTPKFDSTKKLPSDKKIVHDTRVDWITASKTGKSTTSQRGSQKTGEPARKIDSGKIAIKITGKTAIRPAPSKALSPWDPKAKTPKLPSSLPPQLPEPSKPPAKAESTNPAPLDVFLTTEGGDVSLPVVSDLKSIPVPTVSQQHPFVPPPPPPPPPENKKANKLELPYKKIDLNDSTDSVEDLKLLGIDPESRKPLVQPKPPPPPPPPPTDKVENVTKGATSTTLELHGIYFIQPPPPPPPLEDAPKKEQEAKRNTKPDGNKSLKGKTLAVSITKADKNKSSEEPSTSSTKANVNKSFEEPHASSTTADENKSSEEPTTGSTKPPEKKSEESPTSSTKADESKSSEETSTSSTKVDSVEMCTAIELATANSPKTDSYASSSTESIPTSQKEIVSDDATKNIVSSINAVSITTTHSDASASVDVTLSTVSIDSNLSNSTGLDNTVNAASTSTDTIHNSASTSDDVSRDIASTSHDAEFDTIHDSASTSNGVSRDIASTSSDNVHDAACTSSDLTNNAISTSKDATHDNAASTSEDVSHSAGSTSHNTIVESACASIYPASTSNDTTQNTASTSVVTSISGTRDAGSMSTDTTCTSSEATEPTTNVQQSSLDGDLATRITDEVTESTALVNSSTVNERVSSGSCQASQANTAAGSIPIEVFDENITKSFQDNMQEDTISTDSEAISQSSSMQCQDIVISTCEPVYNETQVESTENHQPSTSSSGAANSENIGDVSICTSVSAQKCSESDFSCVESSEQTNSMDFLQSCSADQEIITSASVSTVSESFPVYTQNITNLDVESTENCIQQVSDSVGESIDMNGVNNNEAKALYMEDKADNLPIALSLNTDPVVSQSIENVPLEIENITSQDREQMAASHCDSSGYSVPTVYPQTDMLSNEATAIAKTDNNEHTHYGDTRLNVDVSSQASSSSTLLQRAASVNTTVSGELTTLNLHASIVNTDAVVGSSESDALVSMDSLISHSLISHNSNEAAVVSSQDSNGSSLVQLSLENMLTHAVSSAGFDGSFPSANILNKAPDQLDAELIEQSDSETVSYTFSNPPSPSNSQLNENDIQTNEAAADSNLNHCPVPINLQFIENDIQTNEAAADSNLNNSAVLINSQLIENDIQTNEAAADSNLNNSAVLINSQLIENDIQTNEAAADSNLNNSAVLLNSQLIENDIQTNEAAADSNLNNCAILTNSQLMENDIQTNEAASNSHLNDYVLSVNTQVIENDIHTNEAVAENHLNNCSITVNSFEESNCNSSILMNMEVVDEADTTCHSETKEMICSDPVSTTEESNVENPLLGSSRCDLEEISVEELSDNRSEGSGMADMQFEDFEILDETD